MSTETALETAIKEIQGNAREALEYRKKQMALQEKKGAYYVSTMLPLLEDLYKIPGMPSISYDPETRLYVGWNLVHIYLPFNTKDGLFSRIVHCIERHGFTRQPVQRNETTLQVRVTKQESDDIYTFIDVIMTAKEESYHGATCRLVKRTVTKEVVEHVIVCDE